MNILFPYRRVKRRYKCLNDYEKENIRAKYKEVCESNHNHSPLRSNDAFQNDRIKVYFLNHRNYLLIRGRLIERDNELVAKIIFRYPIWAIVVYFLLMLVFGVALTTLFINDLIKGRFEVEALFLVLPWWFIHGIMVITMNQNIKKFLNQLPKEN